MIPTDVLSPEELGLLDTMEAELFKADPLAVPPPLLFHYTTPEGFQSIIETREIWATHCRFLNDPRELIHGEDVAIDAAKTLLGSSQGVAIRTFLETFVDLSSEMRLSECSAIYVASLSANGDQLSQWRAYGAGCSGYALGFSHLPQPATDSATLQPPSLA